MWYKKENNSQFYLLILAYFQEEILNGYHWHWMLLYAFQSNLNPFLSSLNASCETNRLCSNICRLYCKPTAQTQSINHMKSMFWCFITPLLLFQKPLEKLHEWHWFLLPVQRQPRCQRHHQNLYKYKKFNPSSRKINITNLK